MNLYDKYILPRAINWACQQSPTMRQREKVIPLAFGNVLEIGIGSGLNFSYYNKDIVKHLTAIDPSKETWDRNIVDPQTLAFTFNFIKAFAENLPVDSNSIDSVVVTYTLCTISGVEKAFEEIRRVLKKNGKLIFCEHGKAPDRGIQRWQNYTNPVWKKLSGGCNLNRDIPLIIRENGFKTKMIETMYIPGWKPASFNYWGTAEPL